LLEVGPRDDVEARLRTAPALADAAWVRPLLIDYAEDFIDATADGFRDHRDRMFGRLGAAADDQLDWDHLYVLAYTDIRDGRRRTGFATLHRHLWDRYEQAVEQALVHAFDSGVLAAQFSAFQLAAFDREASALGIASSRYYRGPRIAPSVYINQCNFQWDSREPSREELREFLSAAIRDHARWSAAQQVVEAG
jgi:hypothetical protein